MSAIASFITTLIGMADDNPAAISAIITDLRGLARDNVYAPEVEVIEAIATYFEAKLEELEQPCS
jgi:hypothetical protein